jgi:hypothetical protein
LEILERVKDLVYVNLSESEVDVIYDYVDLDGLEVEIWEGENCLSIKTLNSFRNRLSLLSYHTKTSLDLLNSLNELLGA